jgi:hypothetical protein
MRHFFAAAALLGTGSALIRADDPAVKHAEATMVATSYNLRCTARQCDKVRPGMTVAEAAAVLGCPPGDYTDGKGVYIAFIDPFPVESVRLQYSLFWCGRDGAVGLVLDNDGRVRRAEWLPALDPRR